jgi:cytochrome c
MRFGRGRSRTALVVAGVALLGLLTQWTALCRPRDERARKLDRGTVRPPSRDPGRLPSHDPARAGEGTSTPAAAKMLLHMLGRGTGTIAIIAALWIASQVWMAQQEADAVARALTGGNPANASLLATRYGCGGCHTIPGLPGAEGQVGPPLGGLRQRVFVAGVLPNTADNLINWIVEPRRYSSRSAMPETGIGPEGARDIAAYLYAH